MNHTAACSARDRIAQDRLDALISDLDRRAVQAMRDGDPTGARIYTDQMYAAIASRSPAHQERLHAEVERRIAEQVDYFGYRGQMARELLEKGQA